MNRWLFPVNAKDTYDIHGAYKNLDVIYWGKKDSKVKIGDIVYLYISAPEKQIQYKYQLLNIVLNRELTQEQKKYWKNLAELERYSGDYLILKPISFIKNESLFLDAIRRNHLINDDEIFQGRRNDKIEGKTQEQIQKANQLFDYIDRFFLDDAELKDNIFPEEANVEKETFPEGGKKQITVNVYERDSIARKKCIEIHGENCFVCNMNFGQTYGAFAEGFIHVHHLKPLHQIQQNYKVDPQNDLIPVCPNCHAMLHRKIDGVEMTVNRLKLFYEYRNK